MRSTEAADAIRRNFNLDPHRARRIMRVLLAAAPLMAVIIASSTRARAQSSGITAGRPDLVGRVTAGGAFPKATIFIFTAGPKVGTSTFCPSCYPDCRKSAKSDAQGNYKIESLDPNLTFRILVVAKGYKPQFVPKVDPAKAPVNIELSRVESSEITPDRSIRGQILGADGKPLIGAVVESHGVRRKNDVGTMWGQLPGVDPLAVTDEQGEFVLSAREPFESLDVRVEAPGFANKQFDKLASGTALHKLTLTEGVTVKGRVVLLNKPLVGVSVGMVSVDRGVENFTGNFDIGTDNEGRFAFVNLPPNVDYFIYGLMDTLLTLGAIPIRKIRTGDDGAIVDAGDMVVGPSHRLAGRVVCSDGAPVPVPTRLLISRDQAWDSMHVTLDDKGGFDVQGIPQETITLSVRVGGYHLSEKNLSLDPLNSRLIGRIDQDVTNLVFLLEPGPEQRSQPDMQLPESEWPQNQRLRGAEALPDHSNQWLISGGVRDSQTKEPITRFGATLGNAQAPFNRTSWDERHRTEGTNGNLVAYLNKKFAQPVLKVQAEGYLPRRFTLQPESRTNLDLELQKGTGPSGTVFLPNGEPAQGTSVALLCAGEEQINLNGKGELQAWRHPDAIRFTDPDGSFALPPELDMQQVAAVAKEGFKIVSVEELATNSKVVLERWGKIKGVLHRASNLSTNEDVDLAFQDTRVLNLQLHTMTDAGGRFEFDHVPPGQLQLNGRNMVNANSWAWDPLGKITLKPGEELNLDVHAPTKSERPRTWNETRPLTKSTRLPGPGPEGVILLPNGNPAVDAEVGLLVPGKYISLGKAALKAYEARQEGLVVRAGAGGRFALPNEQGATAIVAVHDAGYAYVPVEKVKSSPTIQLEPWGRIEGTLHIGQHLGTNQMVALESGNFYDDFQLMFDGQDFQARTDDKGRFVLAFVPPGERRIARLISMGVGRQVHSASTSVVVNAGKVTSVVIGGTGRTVIGKVRVTGHDVDWEQVHASLHTQLPDAFKQTRTPEEQRGWAARPEVKLAMKSYRVYPVVFSADGSFRVEEVQPGKYKFDLTVMSGFWSNGNPPEIVGHFERELAVPEPSAKNDPSPADLGLIESKLEPAKQTAALKQ